MRKNGLVKFLCFNLSICMAATAMPAVGMPVAGMTLNSHVQAAETVIAEETVKTDVLEMETAGTETVESEVFEAEESKITETFETETQKTETFMEETQESEIFKTEVFETEVHETEESEITETETFGTAAEETDTDDFIDSLLKKLQFKYNGMYINDDGYFEYTDENGLVCTYDPYDPELYKYLLDDTSAVNEYAGHANEYAANDANSTISPFTKETYFHEAHVSNKIIRHGIDVSKYQKEIDWEKAKKSGVYFAFVRIGYRGYNEEGKISGDGYAKQNIENAYKAGVKVGAYFFSQAITEREAEEEANYCDKFLSDNGLKKYISMPVFIDYEYSPSSTSGRLAEAKLSKSQHQNICDRFVKEVIADGYESGIYANFKMLTNDMQPASSAIYNKTNYWIARYNEATHYGNNYRCWQYSSSGSVDGIEGRVDCNFWYEDKRVISDSTCRISVSTETEYIDDVREAVCVYDISRKYELVEGKDFQTAVSQETVNGTAAYKIVIIGIGMYEGTVVRTVTMTNHFLSADMISNIEPQEYTGLEITQETGLKLQINNGNAILAEGRDYTVSYVDNINAGTGGVIVTGMGNYTGEVRKDFKITGMTLTDSMFEKIPDVVYTGNAITTDTGVIINGFNKNIDYKLTEGRDYTLKYSENKNAGTAKVTVTGKGNYAGQAVLEFNILSQDFSETATVNIGGTAGTCEVIYTGKALKPAVTVTVNGVKLTTADYTVEYGNNIEPTAEAYVIVRGKKNYKGEVKKYFTITEKPPVQAKLTAKMVSLKNTHMYTKDGEPLIPEIYVVNGAKILTEGTDYTVSYKNASNVQIASITAAGKYKIIVNGIGSYKGSITKNLTVVDQNNRVFNDACVKMTFMSESVDFVYNGSAVKPVINVKDKIDGRPLTEGRDYKVSYADNINAGTARIILKGAGIYKGEVTDTFEIMPKNLGSVQQGNAETEVKLNKDSFIYNGRKQVPKITIKNVKKALKQNKDYKVYYTYADSSAGTVNTEKTPKNAGAYEINIVFAGNYSGTAKLGYNITQADLSKLKVTVNKQLYTGSSICPSFGDMAVKLGSVKLDSEALSGVEISGWSNNVYAGKAGFKLTSAQENNNFIKDSVKDVSFNIVKKSVKDKGILISVGGFEASGGKCGLELVYNDGIEYNQSNGAQVIVKDLDTGTALEENKDYTVKFSNNKNAGMAKVTVKGIGGYNGSVPVSFKIIGKSIIDNYRIELSKESYIYSGKAYTPAVKLYYGSTLLKAGRDYTVKHINNVNAGNAGAVITCKGKYSGTVEKNFTILPKQAANASKITVSSIADQKYTGKVIVPKVTVNVDGEELVKGKDYTVSVLNSTKLTYMEKNKEKGTGTMIITGIGNYKGTLAKRSFTVVK